MIRYSTILSISIILLIALIIGSVHCEPHNAIGQFIVQSCSARKAHINRAAQLERQDAERLYSQLLELLTQSTNRPCDDSLMLRAKQVIRNYVFRVWEIALEADEATENSINQGEENITQLSNDVELHQSFKSKYTAFWRSQDVNCKNMDRFVDQLEESAVDLLQQAINARRLGDENLLKRSLQLIHKLIFDELAKAQSERSKTII